MQKKDWIALFMAVFTLSVAFLGGIVRLESRVSRIETVIEEYHREKAFMFDVIEENVRVISRLRGRLDTKSKRHKGETNDNHH